jgi:hypothetical protein
MIKKRRKILFILNLTALGQRFRNLSSLDAKPPGERCFYSTLTDEADGKKLLSKVTPEGQGLAVERPSALGFLPQANMPMLTVEPVKFRK